jgi:hypothetical protein
MFFDIFHNLNTLKTHVRRWNKLTYVVYDNNSNISIKLFVCLLAEFNNSWPITESALYKTTTAMKKKKRYEEELII